MSLVDVALRRHGLETILAARLGADPDAATAARAEIERRARSIDPILLGAMADRVRAAERGDAVRLYIDRPLSAEGARVFGPGFEAASGGLAFVRSVALARLLGHRALAIRVDAEAVGIQIAQVALAFGADELIAPVRTMALQVPEGPEGRDDDEAHDHGLVRLGAAAKSSAKSAVNPATKIDDAARAILRERELATLVRGARRTVRVVEVRDGVERERDVDETTAVKRAFRAPGREGPRDPTETAAHEGAE